LLNEKVVPYPPEKVLADVRGGAVGTMKILADSDRPPVLHLKAVL